MDELLVELGITPIGQDTNHQNSETFSVFHDDPLTALDDSSGSLLELRNAPATPIDLNVLVDNIWSSEMVNKNHLSERDSPDQNHGVIKTNKSMSPNSMANFANGNISIENYSYGHASVTSSETDYSSSDSMEYEYVVQHNHVQKETTDQVSQTFSILFFIAQFVSLYLAKSYISLNIIFRQRIPLMYQPFMKQRKPPRMSKSIPQLR